nr:LIM domain-containing protein A-like [Cherax quadricarinatus]
MTDSHTPPLHHHALCPLHLGGRANLMDGRGAADFYTMYGDRVGNNNPETSNFPAEIPQDHVGAFIVSNHITHANVAQEEPVHVQVEPVHIHAEPVYAHVEPVHTHAEPVLAHSESQPHTHQSQYIQREYSSPLTVNMHLSASFHHMPMTATSIPAPTYTQAYAIPGSYTQTLPHPRSSQAKTHNHPATMQLRSSNSGGGDGRSQRAALHHGAVPTTNHRLGGGGRHPGGDGVATTMEGDGPGTTQPRRLQPPHPDEERQQQRPS